MKTKRTALALFAAGLLLLLVYFLPIGIGQGDLAVSIKHADYLMPAAYKVYANPEALSGEYYLFKMLLTNEGKATLNDVKVSYRIPNYIDWTELESIPKIYAGQHAVVRCYPQFKDDIVNKMTQSREKAEIKITYNAGQSTQENFAFSLMGRNQFVYTDLPPEEVASYPDMFRNDQLLGCFVTPQDPIMKYYTQQLQEKVMRGEQASVSNKPEDAVKFLTGIYAATLASHMVYSGTEGIPQKLGDISSLVQSTRLPREVVTGNTGLCIELSLLYASVLKAAGLHPVIFLIPGHAYPGIEVGGQYYAIEATGIGGEGLGSRMSPEEALKTGMKNLDTFVKSLNAGDNRYSLVDITQLEAKGVVPMELRDDDFLRKKIDEVALNFRGGGPANDPAPQEQLAVNYRSNDGGYGNGGGSAMRAYQGVIGFNYPAGWQRIDSPVAQWPFLVSYIGTPDQSLQIDVFNLPGASNTDQAMEYIRSQLAGQGQQIQYQRMNSANGYFVYQGITMAGGNSLQWQGVFRNSGNGVVGMTIGSYNFAAMSGTINSILSTVR